MKLKKLRLFISPTLFLFSNNLISAQSEDEEYNPRTFQSQSSSFSARQQLESMFPIIWSSERRNQMEMLCTKYLDSISTYERSFKKVVDWANTDQEHVPFARAAPLPQSDENFVTGSLIGGNSNSNLNPQTESGSGQGSPASASPTRRPQYPSLMPEGFYDMDDLAITGIDNTWTNTDQGKNVISLMSWQMNSQGILQYANAENTNPNRPTIPKFPDTENMWDRYARLMNIERNIRLVSPYLIMLQGIQMTEAAMLMDEIASAGYKIRQQTLVKRPNMEFLYNMILVKDQSPYQATFNFSLPVEENSVDDLGVLVLKDRRNEKRQYRNDGSIRPDKPDLVLVNIKLRKQSSGTGSSYSEIMQQAMKQVKIKLRQVKVRDYRIILAGNFLDNPNSLQLQEIKREGFVDISFELPNPKPITWTHPLRLPQRRSYIFIKDGIKIENFSTLFLNQTWKKMSAYDNWYGAIKQGSNHFPLLFNFRVL